MEFTDAELESEPRFDGADLHTVASRGGKAAQALLAALPPEFRFAEWRLEGKVRVWTRVGTPGNRLEVPGAARLWYHHVASAPSGVVWEALVVCLPPEGQMRRALKTLEKVPGMGCC